MPRPVAEIEGAATVDPRQQVAALVDWKCRSPRGPAARWSSLVTWLAVVQLDLPQRPVKAICCSSITAWP
jgi:hypothetical protein